MENKGPAWSDSVQAQSDLVPLSAYTMYHHFYSATHTPASTWRLSNVVLASIQRHDVMMSPWIRPKYEKELLVCLVK